MWVISDNGTIAIDAQAQKVIGFSYFAVTGTTNIPGFITVSAVPTPGNKVNWNGVTFILPKGTYTVYIAVQWVDSTGTTKITQAGQMNIVVPPCCECEGFLERYGPKDFPKLARRFEIVNK